MMKKRMVLFVLVMFSACVSSTARDAGAISIDEPQHLAVNPQPVAIPVPVPVPTPTVEPVSEVRLVDGNAHDYLPHEVHPYLHAATAVTLAPHMYPDATSFLPGVRRLFFSSFNRNFTEARLIRLVGERWEELHGVVILVLSRICVSEANWLHDELKDPNDDVNHAELDCPAIYRVLRRTRARGETLIGTMRRHVHYVTEQWEPHSPRTQWLVELNADNTRPPHFQATDSEGRPLNWDRDYRPRWIAMQQFVTELIAGEHLGPCADAPIIAWGGRCDDEGGACDDHLAEDRGLVPYEHCGLEASGGRHPANRFWCRPGEEGCDPLPVEEPEVEVVAEVD
jgi:hypothetical protein